ncbi:hypothetical protein, partial [Streptococcus pseudopneumoniae]|uniref:hypothetical protein n=1 Tax=Streptococcus pseudopneumoniae TaxID=257758 RepID=UPI001BB1451A
VITAQTLTDAGAVSVDVSTTFIVTTGAAALTLADGSENQSKYIVMKTEAGTAILTPDNLGNGTSIYFDKVGDSAELVFANAAWHMVGGTAALVGSDAWANEIGIYDPTQFCVYFEDFCTYVAGDWTVTETGAATQAIAADDSFGSLVITNAGADNDSSEQQLTGDM